MGLTSPPTSVSTAHRAPAWEGRSIAGPKLRLKQFLAFLSQQPQQQQQQQQQETDNTKVRINQPTNHILQYAEVVRSNY